MVVLAVPATDLWTIIAILAKCDAVLNVHPGYALDYWRESSSSYSHKNAVIERTEKCSRVLVRESLGRAPSNCGIQ